MTPSNGMQGSDTLNNEIFGKQPRACELQARIKEDFSKYFPHAPESPEISLRIERISDIYASIEKITDVTRLGLVDLYVETVTKKHLSDCSTKVAMLEVHQRNRIAWILGASNDENISQAA